MVQTNDFGREEIFCVSSRKCTKAWIIDSKCSYHMTLHRECFTIFRSANFGFVYLGDDKASVIIVIGQIKITMDEGGMRSLNDIRYIP